MFIYFDLGNVIAYFDRARQYRQMAEAAGTTPERVRAVMADSGLSDRYERGELTTAEFCEAFREQSGTRPDDRALLAACADIFWINHGIIPLVAALEAADFRLGLLSNLSPCHWEHLCAQGYGILPAAFSVLALSYEIGAMKPDPKIYRAAAEMAGVPPSEIFFCDDIAAHVTAAHEAGFDAVQFTSTEALAADLVRRGLRFNY